MKIAWKNFITSDFWFGLDRMKLHKIDWAIAYIGIALFVVGLLVFIYSWRVKAAIPKMRFKQVANILLFAGAVEVFWFGLRYQQAAALGTRFAAIFAGAIILVWLYGPIKYFIRNYKTDLVAEQKRIEREKYLNM